ncbi:MAG: hypothetical protein M1370_05490 [Bacteroidetes bacterium]|nr:hypothetical protein [Bacteroidota bacterium]MCL5026058.1 hypothetical protein [Chloroflexota bacterium]
MSATARGARAKPIAILASKALVAGVAASVALAGALRVAFGPHIREDAYITLRYAKHIAAGHGFVFTPGEHVLGTTTPLFALLLGGLARAGIDPIAAAVGISILCDMIAVTVLSLVAARYLPRLGVFFAALSYALLSPLVSYAVSGMETSLYTLLVLSTVLLYVQGRMRATGLLCALLVLTRPDGAILAAVLALHMLLRRPAGAAKAAIVFGLALVPWLAFATAYFGSPVPQSMVAKAQYLPPDPFFSARNLMRYFGDTDNRWFLPLSFVFVLGTIRLKWDRAPALLMAWAASYSLAFMISNKFYFPDWPFEWYFVPLLAPFALGIGAGLERMVSALTREASLISPARAVRWLRPAIAGSAAIVFLFGYGAVLQYQHSELARVVGGREDKYRQLAQRIDEMGIQDETVAAIEIGAFSYYYPGPILDLCGLVTPHVSGTDPTGRAYSLSPLPENAASVLYAVRPPWIMSYEDMLPDEVRRAAWFQREYKPVYAVGTWEGRRVTLLRRYSAPTTPSSSLRVQPELLGDSLELLSSEAQIKPLGSGKVLVQVDLTWKALRPMGKRYTIFVHLRDAANHPVAQNDAEPQANEYPTTRWRADEVVVDKRELIVDAVKLDGREVLVIGAYETSQTNPFRHLNWSSPTQAAWPHELRIPLASLSKGE